MNTIRLCLKMSGIFVHIGIILQNPTNTGNGSEIWAESIWRSCTGLCRWAKSFCRISIRTSVAAHLGSICGTTA